MSNQMLARYEVGGLEISITPETVLTYMIDPKDAYSNGRCTIPQREMMKVIMTCQARKLNPFTGDVVVQPRRDKAGNTLCTLVVTKDFYTRRAAANPKYAGKRSGIVVLTKDGRPIKRNGCAVYKVLGETLLGGWCEVFVQGQEHPEYAEVALDEYDQGFALWKTKPATMIMKVAVSQALRSAFPDEFNGTYEPEEIGLDEQPIVQPPSEPTYETPDQIINNADRFNHVEEEF